MAKQEIKPKLSFKIKINKDLWTVNLYTKATFERKWKGCCAITEFEHVTPDLAINFKGPKVSRDTIAHELMHAFLSYKNHSRLKPDTIEERFCELIGKKYKVLAELTERVFHGLYPLKAIEDRNSKAWTKAVKEYFNSKKRS